MAERYHRAQILLDPGQHRVLREIAEREGRSISAVAREVIEAGLQGLASDESARQERRAQALERLAQLRGAAHAAYGVYRGDLVAEVRADRERALDRARRKKP